MSREQHSVPRYGGRAAPADGDTDTAVKAVHRALTAVSHDLPGGQVVPVEALRRRVDALVTAQRLAKLDQVGRELPDLVRDLHTSVVAGRDVAELLVLAVLARRGRAR